MIASQTQQFLRGAAVAALLIVPTLAAHAQSQGEAAAAEARAQAAEARAEARAATEEARAEAKAEAHEAADEARAAAVEARQAQAEALAEARRVQSRYMVKVSDSGGWVSRPVTNYSVHNVRLDDVVGTVTVAVRDGGTVGLEVSGYKSRVDGLQIRQSGDTLRIEGSHNDSVWDWHDWFNFSVHDETSPDNLKIKLTVPRGAPLRIDGLIGNADIGDTEGPLHFEAAASNAKIGRVGEARISLAGSGKVQVAEVRGRLKLEIAGSGKVRVARTGAVNADVAGAGDAQFGAINGGLDLDIAGSGDVAADRVNGPVKVSIAGSGSIKIAKGQADPLKVDIMGSGNFDFGGHAVNPSLSALGSGRVRLKSYSGHLSSSGSISVRVNGQSVNVGGDDD